MSNKPLRKARWWLFRVLSASPKRVTSSFHKNKQTKKTPINLQTFPDKCTSCCGYLWDQDSLFWLLEETHKWWMCCTDLINRTRPKTVAKGVLLWQSLFSSARMCSPYGPCSKCAPFPPQTTRGFQEVLLYTFRSKYAAWATVAHLITACVSGPTLDQQVMCLGGRHIADGKTNKIHMGVLLLCTGLPKQLQCSESPGRSCIDTRN